MPLSPARRALIAVAIFILLLVAGVAGFYYWEIHRPVPAGPAFSPEIAGPPPDVMSLLPPDSPAVAYIDAEALRKIPNFSLPGFINLVAGGPQNQRAYDDFVKGTGFDASRDLDHAAIAYWLTGFGTPENVLGQDRFVAVADGRFDQPKIKAYFAHLGGKQVTHGTQSIYQAPGNPPISLEFLSPTRVVIAGGRNATDLVADTVSDGSRPRDPAMQLRLQKIGGAPLFAVAKTDHLPQSFYANFQNAPQLDQLARSVRVITLVGQPTGDTLNLSLAAECDSAKNALTISFLLEGGRMAASMAVSSPNARQQMSSAQINLLNALVNQAKIVHQGNQVRINLNVPPTMLSAPAAPKRAS
jgi:hypothetical protein